MVEHGDTARAPDVRLIRALVCLMFLMFAMTSDAVGTVIASVIAEFRLSMKAAGAFHYVPMIAIAVGAVMLGSVADRLGRRQSILAGLALYGVGSLLFAFGRSFAFFVGLLALSGVGISLFKIGGLALLGDASNSQTTHSRLMNAVEGFFAVGSIIGPALVALLLGHGMGWKWLYVAAAAICVALIPLADRVNVPAPREARASVDLQSTLQILKDPYALGFATLISLYVATEVAVYVWMPTYLKSYEGPARWLSLYGLTLFFMLRACGRFLGVWLLARVHWSAALALAGTGIFLCFAAASFGDVRTAVWALPLSGLPMSLVYPTLNSKGISGFPKSQHGAAAGVLLFFTAMAAALAPLAMAAVSDAYGNVRFGFWLASGFALCLCAALLYNWLAEPARIRLASLDESEHGLAATPDP